MAEENSKKEDKEEKKEIPIAEWLIAAVGVILVLGAINLTLYRAVTESNTPPQFEIAAEPPQSSGDGYLVRFSIFNKGNQTAAAVAVEGELKKGAEKIETGSATLTYAPANSVRRGGIYFTKNPQDFELNLRVVGYEEP